MSAIKNVAIAAASGELGSVVFKKLVDSGKFNVRVLKRIGSSSTFPAGTDVVEVDYSSVPSLTAALQGQDAVVSALTSSEVGAQNPLIDAAVAAGVRRFLPSEFGSDLDDAKTRQLPVFVGKVKTQEYLQAKAKEHPEFTYTFVYNFAFLDWGLRHNFLLNLAESSPALFDGGDVPFNATTLASVGDAVVGILTHLEETKNRAVRVRDIETTQNKLLALARQAAADKTWNPVTVKIDDLTAEADKKLAAGDFSFGTFVPYLFRAIFDPSFRTAASLDNELLGIKGVTDADIIEILKPLQQ
ncbi:hypothetical protein BX600DRAFT_468487 [Xylariales sp. PMI_506]|nr:hypothetical protein BX600DRAFT_468487 [Xylariales sp. PMI_506]